MSMFASNKAISTCILIVCVAIFVLLALKMSPFIPDDSYISFRYAENLAEGNGITFNPNERPVEGYSNFLWILLCSILVRFGLDLPYWAPRMGVLFGILNIFLFWLILRRRTEYSWHLVIPLMLLACSAPFLLYAISGMETPLFSFLLLAAIFLADYAFNTERSLWFILFSVTSVLVAFCRPEGVITFPTIAVLLIYFSKKCNKETPRSVMKPLLLASVLFVISLLAYNVWRIRYFGEVIPAPFLSKAGGGGSILRAWYTNLHFFFIRQNHYFAPFGYYYGALTLLAVVALAFEDLRRPASSLELTSLILTMVYMAVYVNFVDWMPGMRYYSALIPLLLIPIARLQEGLFREFNPTSSFRAAIRFSIISIAILLMSLFGVAQLKIDAQRNEESTSSSLVALGKWLKHSIPPGSLMAISDVGATPYYSGLPTLDFNPEPLTDMQIAKYGWSNDYFFKRNPKVVIFVSFSLTEPKFYGKHMQLLNDPRFSKLYRLVGVTRYDWYQDRCYWVYLHRDIELGDVALEQFPKGIGSH